MRRVFTLIVSTLEESQNHATGRSSIADRVDPRAPRFGQAITTVGLLGGIGLGEPLLVFLVTAILVTAVLSRWQLDVYALAWRGVVVPVVGRPTETESASPHRFAKLLGAGFTTVASLSLIAGVVLGSPGLLLVGYAVAGLVAMLAALAAVFDVCVGCRLYGQYAFVRQLGLV